MPAGTTHGMHDTPTYHTWEGMIQRCTNPNHDHFELYGEIGISVCPAWLESFENFFSDMGIRPEGKTLDRFPNCAGDYEPGNCRWATYEEQNNNRVNTVWIEYAGERLPVSIWEKRIGLKRGALLARLRVRGWGVEKALTTPRQRIRRSECQLSANS